MTYSAGPGGFPVGTGGRGLLVAWSLFLLGGFVLAFSLTPDPRGFGTHERLGLPPCTFRALFGIRCPTCGMTTSFAYLTRGRFSQALEANAAGVVLAAACAVQIPWCWGSAIRGRLIGVSRPTQTLLALLLVLAGVSLLNWLWPMVRG